MTDTERFIPKIDPSKPIGPQMLARFQAGDRVAHVRMGDGIVTRNGGEYVVVQYAKGTGEYDVGWFDRYPSFLFHRGG